jgi:DNA-binding PadR family transcriptional regulator
MGRSQLLKGTTSLLVLAVLREGELHGYEIAARIRERTRSTRSSLSSSDQMLLDRWIETQPTVIF